MEQLIEPAYELTPEQVVETTYTKEEKKEFLNWWYKNIERNDGAPIEQFLYCTSWHFTLNDMDYIGTHWSAKEHRRSFLFVVTHDMKPNEEATFSEMIDHLNSVLNRDKNIRMFFMNVVIWKIRESTASESDCLAQAEQFVELLKKATARTEKMTVGDYIRSLSDEELAYEIKKYLGDCDFCPGGWLCDTKYLTKQRQGPRPCCEDIILESLKQEYKAC